ncbi:MAG: hypothetical protein J6P45_01580 [Lachnospiraceae bacterium]|nr:hypothetical protein [Lachnospiraceae bacterium]
MEFNAFAQTVKERLTDVFGPDFTIETTKVLKNNSVRLTGIMILQKDCNIAPTIYLEDYYTDHCDGRGIEEIINDILRVYDRNRAVGNVRLEVFENFEKLKERIIFKLINYEKNLELLSGVPHRRFLDLAVIYIISLGETGMGNASVTIRNEHMKKWNLTEDELWKLARRNAPNISKPEILSLYELIGEITGKNDIDDLDDAPMMYVLTNNTRLNGASCILYEDTIPEFAGKLGKDIFIIPSSVHEVILFPADGFADTDRLNEIINEVNCTQVAEQEILSYRLYRYNRSDGRIVCV